MFACTLRHVRSRRLLIVASWIACVVAAAGLLLGGYRVYSMERAELEQVTPRRTLRALSLAPDATRISARLTSVRLRAGEHAVFELCAPAGLPDAVWRDALDVAVMDLDAKQLLLRVPFDHAHLARARTNRDGACLLLAQGPIEHSATYRVDAVWRQNPPSAAILDATIYTRVLAKPPLGAADRLSLCLLGAGVLALVLSLLLGRGVTSHTPHSEVASPAAGMPRRDAVVIAAVVAIGTLLFATQLPFYGSTLTLAKGVLLLGLEAGMALFFSRRLGGADMLALHGPAQRTRALVAAAAAWPLLVAFAKLSLVFVPATGEAPIETFVSWPSGLLSAALLGVFLPLGEELFFRGYVYGSLLPLGKKLAAALSLLAFVGLHAQQSWGQWGGLFAIACAGATFTGLRMLTGSTLVPALTHVAYNLALSLASILRS